MMNEFGDCHVCNVTGGVIISDGKNPFRLYPKLQSQPIGWPKIFIDYFFFQVDQWDCTKFLPICDRFASSEERFRSFIFRGNPHHFSKGKCFESSSYDFSHLSS